MTCRLPSKALAAEAEAGSIFFLRLEPQSCPSPRIFDCYCSEPEPSTLNSYNYPNPIDPLNCKPNLKTPQTLDRPRNKLIYPQTLTSRMLSKPPSGCAARRPWELESCFGIRASDLGFRGFLGFRASDLGFRGFRV